MNKVDWQARAKELAKAGRPATEATSFVSVRMPASERQVVERVALDRNLTLAGAVRHIIGFYDRVASEADHETVVA